jgi:hypothetical protein
MATFKNAPKPNQKKVISKNSSKDAWIGNNSLDNSSDE